MDNNATPLETQLKKGIVLGTYLLTGADEAGRAEALGLFARYLAEEGYDSWSRDEFAAEDITGPEVADLLNTPPLLGGRRVVVVSDAEALADPDHLLAHIQKPAEFSILILTSSRPLRQLPLAGAIKKAGGLITFSPPKKGDIRRRLQTKARQMDVALDRDALDAVVERIGDDVLRVEKEIEKLAQYAGPEGRIRGRDARNLVPFGPMEAGRFAMFDYVDAVAEGNAPKAMQHLEELLGAGESPLALIGMLARQFHLLLGGIAWQGETPEALASAMGIKAYPAKKAISQARHFRMPDVAAAIEACIAGDQAIKRGVDGRMALEMLTVKLILDRRSQRNRRHAFN